MTSLHEPLGFTGFSWSRATALLVLPPRSTWAWIVSAHLRFVLHGHKDVLARRLHERVAMRETLETSRMLLTECGPELGEMHSGRSSKAEERSSYLTVTMTLSSSGCFCFLRGPLRRRRACGRFLRGG